MRALHLRKVKKSIEEDEVVIGTTEKKRPDSACSKTS